MAEMVNNVVTRKHLALDDLKFNLNNAPMWFASINIVALTHPACYGDRVDQDSPIFVNDVVYYDAPTDLSQIFFKNYNAGDDCLIVASGVLLLKSEMKRLGIPVEGD